ncbi:uncharacterized protein JCM10292_000175 [Rhodotorula paludigena]|uniref:uncharacterized protein n=1 Tax=Rhodotorula paludigena TaxID=86838 RepID=UPI0031744234
MDELSAVVTTCSHIFCVDCANALFSTPQICPACETSLPDLDDVMQMTLNPHDSYKTSILSGLSPTIILDIASRALNFYTYQVQQEAAFQALITKNAQERIAVLEAQCNTMMREATAEINRVEKDLELERRRVHELQETHKANAKAYTKLKTQYDKSKQRALLNPSDPSTFPNPAFGASGAIPAQTPNATRQAFVPGQHHIQQHRPSSAMSSASRSRGGHGWNPQAQAPGAVPFAHAGLAQPQHQHGAQQQGKGRRPLAGGGGVRNSPAQGNGVGAPAGGGGSARKANTAQPFAGRAFASMNETPSMPAFLGQASTVVGGGGAATGGGGRGAC